MRPVLTLALQALLIAYPFRHGRKKLVRLAARGLKGPLLWQSGELRLLLDIRNYIDREIVTKGGFEAKNIAHFCSQSKGCATFFDIGANIGLYSLAMAKAGAPRIVAFEPDPRNRHQMAANLFLNGLDTQVTLRPEAVGPRSEERLLYAQRGEGVDLSTGLSSLVRPEIGGVSVPVQTIALDEVYAGLEGQFLAIKMDIEGFELEALKGMKNLLAKNKIFLQIEISENLAEVRDLLAAAGLREMPQLETGSKDYYFEKTSL